MEPRFPLNAVSAILESSASLLTLPGRIVGLVASAEQMLATCTEAVAQIEALTARSASLIDGFAEPLAQLQPTVQRLAETFSSKEVEALVSLIDRLPQLAESVDDELIPLLHRLDRIAPDLHQMLEGVSDMNRVLSKVPGINLPHRAKET